MSFHNWYSKSIEEAHKRYDHEDKEKEAARKIREGLDAWRAAKTMRDDKRRLKNVNLDSEEDWSA